MRTGVLALAAIAFAQPTLAREPSQKPSHQSTRHYHAHAHHAARHHLKRHHRRVLGAVRLRDAAPIESGYSIPQSFARTDAADTPFQHAWNPNAPQAVPAFGEPRRMRASRRAPARNNALDAMIARHAQMNGLPVELVHRVVIRESGYNPRARSKGNIGLMQIKHGTARGVGYAGSASGLLDPETNLTYAVRYLAGAYRAAGGNANRAVAYYASGYHGRGGRVARQQSGMQQSGVQQWGVQQSGIQTAPVSMRETDMIRYEPMPRRSRLRRR